ncbi:Endonuclease-reverse transcriptase [Popillia japonica]|uniref:Endonuclease-reverse transcriptase n=1 Tax=Popillia japonica TaxID=7064 RepID=A0AAW1IBF4_POPJA
MTLKILQTNLGRGRRAHDLAYATAKQSNVDILIVGEPNKKIVDGKKWVTDGSKDVAILFVNKCLVVTNVERKKGYLVNKCLVVTNVERKKGYLRVNLGKWDLYCCYISPNISIEEYMKLVDEIANQVKTTKREAVIAGDVNAKSHMWESPKTDSIGEY